MCVCMNNNKLYISLCISTRVYWVREEHYNIMYRRIVRVKNPKQFKEIKLVYIYYNAIQIMRWSNIL